MRNITIVLIILLTGCFSRNEADQGDYQTDARYGQLADRPIVFRERSGSSNQNIEMTIDHANLRVRLHNQDSKPIYIPGDTVLGLTYKDPHFHLIIMNMDGEELGVCGNFEIAPENYEPTTVNSGDEATFSIPIDEIKNRYCADVFLVQGIVSVRSGENKKDIISKSNIIEINSK